MTSCVLPRRSKKNSQREQVGVRASRNKRQVVARGKKWTDFWLWAHHLRWVLNSPSFSITFKFISFISTRCNVKSKYHRDRLWYGHHRHDHHHHRQQTSQQPNPEHIIFKIQEIQSWIRCCILEIKISSRKCNELIVNKVYTQRGMAVP